MYFLANMASGQLTYKDVKSMSLRRLRELSRENGLDGCQSEGRNTLEIMLCEKLSIAVDGKPDFKIGLPYLRDNLTKNEIEEFQKYTITNIWSMIGWTKRIDNMPEIDISHVKKYLSTSSNPYFTPDLLRKYKCTRAYQHVEARHIHSIEFHPLPDSPTFCLVRAKCCPSQSSDEHKMKSLHVVLDKHSGEPYGGYCSCTVGCVN